MTIKELLKELLKQFFVVTTLISIGVGILGFMLQPEATFGYDKMFYPMIYAALSLLPTVVMYSRKELSVKAVIIRKIIQLIVIEVIILGIVFGGHITLSKYRTMEICVAISIFVIFALAHVISYILDSKDARKMNDDLERLLINVKIEE